MDLNFNNQKHKVVLSPRALGDIEYKQRVNWSAKNKTQRERANLMFDRLHQALYNLANESDFKDYSKSSFGEYQHVVTDNFAVINFILYKTNDDLVVYVTGFLWPYKKDKNSWWYIVESNVISNIDKLLENYYSYLHYLIYSH